MNRTVLMLTIAGASVATAASAADYKATCSRGNDARVIEVVAPGAVGKSCDVRYTRGAGNTSVPYHADSNSAFCNEKARLMAQRLTVSGFVCTATTAAPALRAEAAAQSDYVVEAKRLEPAPAPEAPAPASHAPREQSAAPPATTDAVAVAAAETAARSSDVDAMMAEILEQPPVAGEPAQLVASQAKVEPAGALPPTAGRLVGAAPDAPAAAVAPEPKAATVATQASMTAPEEPTVAEPERPKAAPAEVAQIAPAEAVKTAASQPAKPAASAPVAARGPGDVIVATLMAQAAAWNEGDLDGFMNGYVKDDSLRFVSGGAVIKGWNAVTKRYRDQYQGATGFGQLGFDKLDVRLVTDDVAVVTGQFNLNQNGTVSSGLFSLVMRRADGVWRIVHDHTSSGTTQ